MDKPTNPLEAAAWAGALHYAIGQPELLAEFRKDTGCTYQPPKSAIDQMIDDATGHSEAFVEQFVAWFNKEIWGPFGSFDTTA